MKSSNNKMRQATDIIRTTGLCVAICLLANACAESYTPKPRGYFRIEPEQAIYQPLPSPDLPYMFEVSTKVSMDTLSHQQKTEGWLTFHYPEMGATLYCSYLQTQGTNLDKALSDSRRLVLKQQGIENIQEKSYRDLQNQVYGSLYLLEGDCASPVQFVLTDSTSRFFRGALYYDFAPKADSIAPVTEYLQKDIIHLIETFHWK